jgi:hypothetical protein
VIVLLAIVIVLLDSAWAKRASAARRYARVFLLERSSIILERLSILLTQSSILLERLSSDTKAVKHYYLSGQA